jgi:hypothetical protein
LILEYDAVKNNIVEVVLFGDVDMGGNPSSSTPKMKGLR